MENNTQTVSTIPSPVPKVRGWMVLVIVILLLGVYLASVYNRLATANEAVNNQWAQVESQYQRRFDLIPNLVESVKGVMKQEQEVFGKLADARTRYSGATSVDQKVAAAGEVDSALSRLLVVMENYPQLKSAENVNTLMSQLEGTENRISVERGRFNDSVKEYNLLTKRFPGNLFASLFGYDEHAYFVAAKGSEVAPKVGF